MSQPTIRGWFMEVPSIRGRDGMHIQESGLEDLTCHSDLVLGSAGSEVLAGAGLIGDSIGTAGIRFMAVAGISPAAPLSTTGQISTGLAARRAYAGHGGVYQGRGGAYTGHAGVQPRGEMGARGNVYNHPGAVPRPFNGNQQAARGYAEPRGQSGVRSGAFSGFDHGGQTRSFSSRGQASFAAEAAGAADSTAAAGVTAAVDGVSRPKHPTVA